MEVSSFLLLNKAHYTKIQNWSIFYWSDCSFGIHRHPSLSIELTKTFITCRASREPLYNKSHFKYYLKIQHLVQCVVLQCHMFSGETWISHASRHEQSEYLDGVHRRLSSYHVHQNEQISFRFESKCIQMKVSNQF